MSVKETTQAGNRVIHTKAERVKDVFSVETKQVIEDLVDTMRHEDLVGMAAPQIGIGQRIFVTEIRKTEFRNENQDECRVFINPELLKTSDSKTESYEGCGSVASAQFFGPVSRPEEIVVKAQNEKGEWFELSASRLLARVIQHEIDHLDGIIFPEKISDMKKVMSKSEYLKHK